MKSLSAHCLAVLLVPAALSAQTPPPGPDGAFPPAITQAGRSGAGGPWQGPQGFPGGPGAPFGPQGPQGGPGAKGGPQGLPLMAFLAITPVQDKAMRTIQEQHRMAQADKRKALGDKAAALRRGLEDPALTEAQVRALAGAAAEARLQVVLEERATFMELQGVLTPEQKAKAQRLRVKLDREREAHEELMAEMGELEPMERGGGPDAGPGAGPCPGR